VHLLLAWPSWQAQASKENVAKILQYVAGKRLFKAAEVEADLGLSKSIVLSGFEQACCREEADEA